eukprot:CAMPEP_0118961920 /NCGR_PEP_ID=MMETSP1173-20130426/442_1 /TAXON_ID=1034831 /ORGANISM="Rhizochromulina marina cf, Strain CCMP1243" /LENGTH=64 /DNA_ID=CAMNT_0006910123 /DNA_START=47 /DNA_END=241 /DNA_ORIENTATION=+
MSFNAYANVFLGLGLGLARDGVRFARWGLPLGVGACWCAYPALDPTFKQNMLASIGLAEKPASE